MTEVLAIAPIGTTVPKPADAVQPGAARGLSGTSREVVEIFELGLQQQSSAAGLRASLADPNRLADKVLSSLENIRSDYTSLLGQAEARLQPGPATAGQAAAPAGAEPGDGALADRMVAAQLEIKELMWLQLNIGRVMVQEELMSKVAGRSTTNVDMLLRGQ